MDATFWTTVALIVFLAVIVWQKVPAMITRSLDDRAEKIRDELNEARRLREEAQSLLADYQRRRQEAEGEADAIVRDAREEAERLTAETNRALEEMIVRRTRAAEDKIAQAETQAVAEVRARAADIAILAAEKVLASKIKGPVAEELTSRSIDQVKAHLN